MRASRNRLRAAATAEYASPRFSPDGTRLALSMTVDGNVDVWVYDIGRDTMSRLTSTPGLDYFAGVEPQTAHTSYSRRREIGEGANLYWMRAMAREKPSG